jgi:hypothetical protein
MRRALRNGYPLKVTALGAVDAESPAFEWAHLEDPRSNSN